MPAYVVVNAPSGKRYIVSGSSDATVGSLQDFLDLVALGMENGTLLFLFARKELAPAFYDLRSGLAGAILQKVSDYGARLAIVGHVDDVRSQAFRGLVHECNKGRHVRFCRSRDEALSWLLE